MAPAPPAAGLLGEAATTLAPASASQTPSQQANDGQHQGSQNRTCASAAQGRSGEGVGGSSPGCSVLALLPANLLEMLVVGQGGGGVGFGGGGGAEM